MISWQYIENSRLRTNMLSGGFLLCAALLYAFASTPTPEQPGMIHLVIAMLVGASLITAGAPGAIQNIFHSGPRPLWIIFGGIFCAYALIIPLPLAMLNGNPSIAVLRDLTGLFFWLLPVLYLSGDDRFHFARHLKNFTLLACLIIGLAFSVRFLYALYTITGRLTLAPAHPDIPLELVNMPTVLFSALYLSASALIALQYKAPKTKLKGLGAAALAIAPVLAGIAALQRANLGGLAILCMLIVLILTFTRPLRLFWPLVLIGAAGFVTAPITPDIISLMLEKTRLVGFNMRFEEAQAVFTHLDHKNTAALIPPSVTGLGWGASFISPAAGMSEISFTHNFFLTLYLKAGIAGFFAGGAFILALVLPLFGIFFSSLRQTSSADFSKLAYLQKRMALILSLIIPVWVNLLLYATHKSFDFGLLLTLCACLVIRHKRAKNSGYESPPY